MFKRGADGGAYRRVMDTTPRAATGEHTTGGIPHTFTALTPFLALEDPRGALDFYRDVFGATILGVTEMGGVVVHAELSFPGGGRLQLGAVNPEYHLVAAPPGEDDCFSIGLYCEDADAVTARAEGAGATVREPATTFISGDRFSSIRDPFGVRWSIMTRIEDLSEEESARRVEEWAAQNS